MRSIVFATLFAIASSSVSAGEVAEVVSKAKSAIVLLSWEAPSPTPAKLNVNSVPLNGRSNQVYYELARDFWVADSNTKVYANGLLVSADGLIVAIGPPTLPDQVEEISVMLPNNVALEAKRLVVDQRTGLCLLKVQSDAELPYLELEIANPNVGDSLVNVHRVADNAEVASVGILAAQNRNVASVKGLLQTDLRVSPGSSGSPVLTRDGKLAGLILSSKANDVEDSTGATFAVDANKISSLLENVEPNRSVVLEPAYLGVALEDQDGTVRVRSVLAGSGAEKAGLKVEDVIVEVAGQEMATTEQVQSVVAESEPEIEIAIKIQRGDQTYVLPAQLGKRPKATVNNIEVQRVVPGVSIPLGAPADPQSTQVLKDQYAKWLQQLVAAQAVRKQSLAPATKSLRVQRSGLDEKVEQLSTEMKELKDQLQQLQATLDELNGK
ncbi:MAG: trypsin-like peptidase domain-containing protein [Planctomycetota bacterium]